MAPHLCWRIFIRQGSEKGWEAYFRRIELIDESGQPARGGIAWHKNMETEPGRIADHAFDGDLNTSYRTAFNPGVEGDWIAYKHTHPIDVRRLILNQYGNDGNHVLAIDLEYSDDNGLSWHTIHSPNNLPLEIYDSGLFTPTHTCIRAGTLPVTIEPPKIEVYPELDDFMVVERSDYCCNIGGAGKVKAFVGQRVAVIISKEVEQELWPTDVIGMFRVVQVLEHMLTAYDEVVGRVPSMDGQGGFEGRVRYEVAYINAAGLAHHGVAGVAVGPAFIRDMYESALNEKARINHALLYETARNYIFPEHFTAVLDFHLSDGPDCWGWVNQSFINVMGCLLCEHILNPIAPSYGVDFNYYGSNRQSFLDSMEANLIQYIESPGLYSWENTFNKERLPWNQNHSVDNLYSGLLVHLYRKFGGKEFLKRFYHTLPTMLAHVPKSKSDALQARDNYVVVASIAARKNLIPFFRQTLRWNVSDNATHRLAEAGL